ncbi:hypothetical protein HZC53_04660 [Candidatus Uhrbacteria bacterium]|nr:hypothetical protein [Candidatus Uhrbacteria bacterium]
MERQREAILRTLCFHAAWSHAPTLPELMLTLDGGEIQNSNVVLSLSKDLSEQDVSEEIIQLKQEGMVSEEDGRLGLVKELPEIIQNIRERDIYQPRKRRRAVKVARWLAALGGVRFVALANTTALGSARDQGDLDFFVVSKAGTIWSTRLLGVGPFKLAGLLPTKDRRRDTICLSYFIADDALDLSPHMLTPDDPYFRYWFLSLMPLYDDGIGQEIWEKNAGLRQRHPLARRWSVPPDFSFKAEYRVPRAAYRVFETVARPFQRRWFPSIIKQMMNLDTRVMVNDKVLKFHVDDRRAEFREKYRDLCRKYGIAS